jgi:hypothetical protein
VNNRRREAAEIIRVLVKSSMEAIASIAVTFGRECHHIWGRQSYCGAFQTQCDGGKQLIHSFAHRMITLALSYCFLPVREI